MPKLGDIKDHGFDADNHQQLERLEAIAQCPGCGDEVLCWSDTEEWTRERDSGPWLHSQYGPAQGMCDKCELLIVHAFDRTEVYDLGKARREAEQDRRAILLPEERELLDGADEEERTLKDYDPWSDCQDDD